jgi:hypothetical protein
MTYHFTAVAFGAQKGNAMRAMAYRFHDLIASLLKLILFLQGCHRVAFRLQKRNWNRNRTAPPKRAGEANGFSADVVEAQVSR